MLKVIEMDTKEMEMGAVVPFQLMHGLGDR